MANRPGVIAGLAMGLMLSASAFAAVINLDEESAAIVGSTSAISGKAGFLNQDGLWVTGTGASATFTPGVSGTYNLWADWYTWGGATRTFTINHAGGSNAVSVNANLGPGQTATGAWYTGTAGSGYYYLGQYTLNSGSTVVMTDSANTILFDTLRLSTPDEIFIVDEHAALASNPANWADGPAPYSAPTLGTDPNLTWAWNVSTAVATLTYTPGVSAAQATIRLSWAVRGTGSNPINSAVKYWFDPDGGDDSNKVLLATIDENKYADQTTGPTSTWQWSGWYTASGQYDLTANSTIILDTNGSARTSADAIGIVMPAAVPEPGTMLLLGSGALFTLGWLRRRNMR